MCLAAYYPGVLSPDSLSAYRQARYFTFNDAYPPLFALLWAGIDYVSPGPQGMLIVLLALYWGALFVLAEAAAAINRWIAPAMLGLGFMPFTINFAGTIWSDVLLATAWLLAAGLVFRAQIRARRMSATAQAAIWALFLIGAWVRFNSLFAAVPLALYLLKPNGPFRLRSRLAVSVLVVAGLWFGNWMISHPILKAEPRHTVHAVLTYDLGGISHFSGRNHFPVDFDHEETAKIVSSCYTPLAWSIYKWGECRFVFERLRENGLWGSSTLWSAWFSAIKAEPSAYARHKVAHYLHFTTTPNYIFHEGNSPEEIRQRFDRNAIAKALRDIIFARSQQWVFLPLFWLVLAGGCVVAGNFCAPPSRRLVTALGLSSMIYLATYSFVGVASDFRYAYWAVLATSVSAIVLACELAAAVARGGVRASIAAR